MQPLQNLNTFMESRYNRLSQKQRVLARFVMSNVELVAFSTTAEIAQRAGAHAATVVRFAQALGFSGFLQFQQSLRHAYLSTRFAGEAVRETGALVQGNQILRRTVNQDIRNLETVLRTVEERQITDLAKAIDRSERVVVVASGSYAALATVLVHLCRFMGYVGVESEHRGGAYLALELGHLKSSDLVIGIGFWQNFREATEAVAWANSQGIPTAAITDQLLSPLARHADTVLLVPSESPSFYQSLTAALSVVYAIVAALPIVNPEVRGHMNQVEEVYKGLRTFDLPPFISDK